MSRHGRDSNRCFVLLLLAAVLPACREPAPEGAAPSADHEPAVTDRIAIPAAVQQNLGITFVRVERRAVERTRRLPGQFELRPEARREYHVMVPGRIDLLVGQYERVVEGQTLFTLESPEWQKMQSDMVSALNAMKRSHADLAVAEALEAEVQQAATFLEQRIAKLADANVRQVELEAELANRRNTLPRVRAEVQAAETEFDAAHSRYDVMLSTAAALTGVSREALDPDEHGHAHLAGRQPPWRSIQRLTIRAEAAGVVERLAVTNRGWAETGDLVLDTIDPTALRFHGDALQTDITLFRDGQRARIVPPQGGSIDLQDTAEGTIEVGVQAHPEQRTIPLYVRSALLPGWAKAGVTAYVEVTIDGASAAVLAIPESAVVNDGLDPVFFRRDPNDPSTVIRCVADLGIRDGRWVELLSGVMPDDQVVLGGVYPLMLASSVSGTRQKGGHFHADGSFHGDEDH